MLAWERERSLRDQALDEHEHELCRLHFKQAEGSQFSFTPLACGGSYQEIIFRVDPFSEIRLLLS